MYQIGEEIYIEDDAERHLAHVAASASDPSRPSPLPMLNNVETPFTLGAASSRFIRQGLANIALANDGVLYEDIAPELASAKLDELFGEIDSPVDFASPLPENEPRQN